MLLFTLLLVLLARIRSSRVVHGNLSNRVSHILMQFIYQPPTARITNRFSMDTYTIDQAVSFSMRLFEQFTDIFIGILSVVVVTSYLIIIIVPIVLFYCYIQKYFISTVRELRRTSSLPTRFNETSEGYLKILSFGKRKEFDSKNKHLVDNDIYYP